MSVYKTEHCHTCACIIKNLILQLIPSLNVCYRKAKLKLFANLAGKALQRNENLLVPSAFTLGLHLIRLGLSDPRNHHTSFVFECLR